MGLFQPTTPLLPAFPRACLADPCRPAPLVLSHVEGLTLNGAEGPAPSGASASAAYVTFELSPQPAGSRLREESTPRTSSAQPERTLRADKNKSARATRDAGARKFALSNPNSLEPASPIAGGPTRQYRGERDVFTDTENKPLTPISNRNTNERRKLTTPSKSTISKFLIATRMHVSEEKAKSEETANLLKALRTDVPGMHFADDRKTQTAREPSRAAARSANHVSVERATGRVLASRLSNGAPVRHGLESLPSSAR